MGNVVCSEGEEARGAELEVTGVYSLLGLAGRGHAKGRDKILDCRESNTFEGPTVCYLARCWARRGLCGLLAPG